MRGHNHLHLFLYTRPETVDRFRACGFYRLVEVPELVAFMENTPIGMPGYCTERAALRQPGEAIGAIVMNANPFTFGLRHLVEYAIGHCDWLHLFVIAEDSSFIAYRDRLAVIKGRGRQPIAPALGITRRFVGTGPFCITPASTTPMRPDSPFPPVEVVEIPRRAHDEVPISASEVRRLLTAEQFGRIGRLMPPFTLALLREKYRARVHTFADSRPTRVDALTPRKGQEPYENI